MEFFSLQTKHLTSILLYLSISSLLLSTPSLATIPSGTIQRITKQQILVSIPPNSIEDTQPFLTSSPSGKYTAYLLRRETAPAAGGFGNDFCYVQVQDASSKESMWESECAPVSTANACSLVFTDQGLELFDGSESVWNGVGKGESFPSRLDLVDDGDMRVIDKKGELFWRASDEPHANQGCGLPGSPGLAPESPPFSEPIGNNGNLPFGQQQPNGVVVGQQQQQSEQSRPVGPPPPEEPVGAPPPPQNEEEQPVGAPQANEVFGQQQEEPPVGAPQANGVFGQQQQQQMGVQGPSGGLNGLNQPSDSGSGSGSDVRPLVDYNRYDSGSPRIVEGWVGMCLGLVCLLVYGIIF